MTLNSLFPGIMKTFMHKHNCNHQQSSLFQTFEELDFERSIYYCAVTGNLEKLKKFNSNLDAKDTYGYTCLHYAALNGRLNVCEYLLARGVELDLGTGGGSTALLRACLKKHYDIVELLVRNGARIDIMNSDGISPLLLSKSDARLREILEH